MINDLTISLCYHFNSISQVGVR